MRFGSLFSGIEAASVAWHPLGWEAAFVADVDRFACAHLAHRFPEVPNLGDVAAEDFVERARACGPIDVLVGGSPCQAFSFAGKRQSLADDRGNLTLRFTEIADELDPDFIVWENVPGVLSTKDNAFGCLLAALAGESSGPLVSPRRKWPNAGHVAGPRRTVAWRVLDAQHCGVAQRRKRVFVVASTRKRCAGDVLFEYGSPRRDQAPRRPAWQAPAAADPGGAVALTGLGIDGESLPTLRASSGDCGGGSEALIVQAAAFSAGNSEKARGIGYTEEGTPPLRAGQSGSNQVPTVVYGIIDAETVAEGVLPTMTARREGGGNMTAIAYPEVVGTLCASGAGTARPAGQGSELDFVIAQASNDNRTRWIVRRLTPRECERLQGFPDDWTLVPYTRGKLAADSPRYKALGNSMAVPVMRWIGERIASLVASGRMAPPELYPEHQVADPAPQETDPVPVAPRDAGVPCENRMVIPLREKRPARRIRLDSWHAPRGQTASAANDIDGGRALRRTEQTGGRIPLR
ncbi:DNA cytosine methyltransferase [Microvirga massiliensis]|uniref:DNA cytosine methyltransferase n=1 Tax=Microvirga massiliensis TaxID=1033741 RepID=UPI00065FE641|nr:DNA cytosine methyltransferase [Microvirga massiliensis]